MYLFGPGRRRPAVFRIFDAWNNLCEYASNMQLKCVEHHENTIWFFSRGSASIVTSVAMLKKTRSICGPQQPKTIKNAVWEASINPIFATVAKDLGEKKSIAFLKNVHSTCLQHFRHHIPATCAKAFNI